MGMKILIGIMFFLRKIKEHEVTLVTDQSRLESTYSQKRTIKNGINIYMLLYAIPIKE